MKPSERTPNDTDPARHAGIAEDRRWVLAAQGGDREAFGDLVRKYTGVVRALAAARVGWGAVADDVVQDVFLIALRRLGSLAEPERFAGWISRIAVNRAREVLRREAPRRAASLDQIPVEPSASDAPDRLELEDEVDRMQAAISTLDEKTQLILTLRYRRGLAVRDVAALVGDRPPAVSMRITRAMRRLRELLGADG
jgi:RNA polymerase sigma-70 factor (ECF subfamily)